MSFSIVQISIWCSCWTRLPRRLNAQSICHKQYTYITQGTRYQETRLEPQIINNSPVVSLNDVVSCLDTPCCASDCRPKSHSMSHVLALLSSAASDYSKVDPRFALIQDSFQGLQAWLVRCCPLSILRSSTVLPWQVSSCLLPARQRNVQPRFR